MADTYVVQLRGSWVDVKYAAVVVHAATPAHARVLAAEATDDDDFAYDTRATCNTIEESGGRVIFPGGSAFTDKENHGA
jgi:hypothetical protein